VISTAGPKKVPAGRRRTLSRTSVELAPTPRRSVPFAAPHGAAEVLRLPRPRIVSPAPLLAVLGLLVLVNVGRAGEGGWVFHAGKAEPHGALGFFVSLAGGRWSPGLLKFSAVVAGLVLVVALVYARERWTARRALLLTFVVTGLLVVPGVLLQAGLRGSTAPWFYTNDSTYQIEVAGDLVLDGQTPYGHDYRGTGIERFYSRDGSPGLRHKALDHFAYFPGTAITAAGWRLLPAPFDDYRLLVLLATLGLIPAALSFAGPLTVRLAIGAALAANPLVVQAAWFGTADAPALFFLVLAFGLASRSRFVWAAACLAAAVLLKQFALVAIPFLAAMLLTSRGGRQSFKRAAGVFAGVVAVGALPFLIASPGALWADTIGYGTGDYRIIGYGLASLLVRLDVLADRNAAYPFGLLALFVWLPPSGSSARSFAHGSRGWAPPGSRLRTFFCSSSAACSRCPTCSGRSREWRSRPSWPRLRPPGEPRRRTSIRGRAPSRPRCGRSCARRAPC
jgi:Glycosyltransferase family 87